MKGFHENLVGIGPICNDKYSVLFNNESVMIISPTGTPVLKGWREATGNRLWRMSLLPNADKVTTVEASPGVTTTTLKAYSAYDLPSVEALVRYFHAAAGYPVKDTWLKAIKAGTYSSSPGLTLQNATKYCPVPIATLKGHMVQTRQIICSTKPKPPSTTGSIIEQAKA